MSLKDEYAVIPDTDEDGEKPIPKLFLKIVTVYNEMLKVSEEREEDGAVVWSGALTSFLDNKAGVPQSQYSRVIGTLTDMQCIAQLRRGSGTIPSQWAMLGPPKLENYHHQRKRAGYKREKRVDPLVQQIADLNREIQIQAERINRIVVQLGMIETPEDFEEMFRTIDAIAEARSDDDGEDQPE